MAVDIIKILIADDHRVVTEGLRTYLDGRDGLEVVGTAASGLQAVELTRALKPDVVLLEIRLPDLEGFKVLAAIKVSCPRTGVLILTAHPSIEYLARAVSLGAGGFLSKEMDPKHLPHAIRAVFVGDAIIDRTLLRSALELAGERPATAPEPAKLGVPSLTSQEHRVLQLVAEGLDNEAIASALSVSRNTVKTHTRNIFSKLGVTDRTQAAIWALRSGLVPH